jgi:adenylate kinase family enzyme
MYPARYDTPRRRRESAQRVDEAEAVTQVTVRTPDELAAALTGLPPAVVIGIDGVNGAGKSTLAVLVAEKLGADVLHLDDALPFGGITFTPEQLAEIRRMTAGQPESTEGYVGQLNFDKLRERVRALQLDGHPLIVDGICLRIALARLELQADRHVYVKTFNSRGRWVDEMICDVARIREADEFNLHQNLGGFDPEIRAYNLAHDPVGRADVIYERVKT